MRKKQKTVTRGLFRALPVVSRKADHHIRTRRHRISGNQKKKKKKKLDNDAKNAKNRHWRAVPGTSGRLTGSGVSYSDSACSN